MEHNIHIPFVITKTGLKKIFKKKGYRGVSILKNKIIKNQYGFSSGTDFTILFDCMFEYKKFTNIDKGYFDNINLNSI